MIVELLDKILHEAVVATPQPVDGVTYARKVDKNEAFLDWRKPGEVLDREIRAFNPAPGARTSMDGVDIKIWRAHHLAAGGPPGQIHSAGDEGVVVYCGEGALALTELQRAGGKRLGAREFLRGHPLAPGARFEMPAD